MQIDAPRIPFSVVVLALAAAGVAFYVWRKGGVNAAAKGAGAAVVNAAGAVVSGGVGAVSEAVGVPTPDDTTQDPAVSRWLIDNAGFVQASLWSGVPALWSASQMAPGTGQPPPQGSKIAKAFPGLATYDETFRLMKRYPAPPKQEAPPVDIFDPTTWGLGQ